MSFQSYQVSSSESKVNPEALKTKADELLSSLGIPTETLINSGITYLEPVGEELVSTENLNKAKYLKLEYQYSLSGIPTIQPSSEMSLTLDLSGNLFSLDHHLFPNTTEVGKYPTINFQEALRLLQDGNFSLVSREGDTEHSILFDVKGKVVLNKAYLAYYLPAGTTEVIQPVWVFEGTNDVGIFKLNTIFTVPAIDPKFLVPPTTQP